MELNLGHNLGHNNNRQDKRDDSNYNGQDAKARLQSVEHNHEAQQERHRLAQLHLSHCSRE